MSCDTITLVEFGERLRVLRLLRRWTQERVELEAGIARGTLSHYEGARRRPTVEALLRLVPLLGSPAYLFGLATAPDLGDAS